MKKLEDLIDEALTTLLDEWQEWLHNGKPGEGVKLIHQAKAKLNQHIRAEMLAMVGEDEVRPLSGPKRNGIDQGLRRARNRLRNEQRQYINKHYPEVAE